MSPTVIDDVVMADLSTEARIAEWLAPRLLRARQPNGDPVTWEPAEVPMNGRVAEGYAADIGDLRVYVAKSNGYLWIGVEKPDGTFLIRSSTRSDLSSTALRNVMPQLALRVAERAAPEITAWAHSTGMDDAGDLGLG